jgi:hypothetical protein
MTIAAFAMNGLLVVLLLAALAFGWRLERRLKALKDSHEGFAKAVADLDAAALRAEQGLADLRAATDEAAETLAERIAAAKELAMKLDAPVVDRPVRSAPRELPPREAPQSRAKVDDELFEPALRSIPGGRP